jgi:hypothetical protein
MSVDQNNLKLYYKVHCNVFNLYYVQFRNQELYSILGTSDVRIILCYQRNCTSESSNRHDE